MFGCRQYPVNYEHPVNYVIYMDFTDMTYLITMYNVVFTVKGFPAKWSQHDMDGIFWARTSPYT